MRLLPKPCHAATWQDIRQFAEWGVDHIAVDNCANPNTTAQSVFEYQRVHDALVKVGKPMIFGIWNVGSGKPWAWAPRLGHYWRTGPDLGTKWEAGLLYPLKGSGGSHRTPLAPVADPLHPLQIETAPRQCARTSAETFGSAVRPIAAH